MFPRLQNDRRNPNSLGLCQCISHQRVGMLAAFLRFEVVRLIKVQRIDFFLVDELHNLDGLGQFSVGFLQIFVGNFNVLTLLILITARDLFPWHLHILGIAKSFVGDRTHVLLMEVVKRKLVSPCRAENRNRNGNECETDAALPNSSHVPSSPSGRL